MKKYFLKIITLCTLILVTIGTHASGFEQWLKLGTNLAGLLGTLESISERTGTNRFTSLAKEYKNLQKVHEPDFLLITGKECKEPIPLDQKTMLKKKEEMNKTENYVNPLIAEAIEMLHQKTHEEDAIKKSITDDETVKKALAFLGTKNQDQIISSMDKKILSYLGPFFPVIVTGINIYFLPLGGQVTDTSTIQVTDTSTIRMCLHKYTAYLDYIATYKEGRMAVSNIVEALDSIVWMLDEGSSSKSRSDFLRTYIPSYYSSE